MLVSRTPSFCKGSKGRRNLLLVDRAKQRGAIAELTCFRSKRIPEESFGSTPNKLVLSGNGGKPKRPKVELQLMI